MVYKPAEQLDFNTGEHNKTDLNGNVAEMLTTHFVCSSIALHTQGKTNHDVHI